MCTIILARHGENDWSKANRLAGWTPGVHLNENGHRQAQALAERLAPLPVKAVYSSPLTRCMETAAYVAAAHRMGVLQLEDVGEVRYGRWEGKKVSKLARKPEWIAVQFYPSRMRFPDGEALREVQFRAVQALETLSAEHAKSTIVVVSHADLIRLVLAHYLGMHIDVFQRLVIAPASASVLVLGEAGGARVVRLNDDGPLRPPPATDKKGKKRKKKGKKSKTEGAEAAKDHGSNSAPASDSYDEEE